MGSKSLVAAGFTNDPGLSDPLNALNGLVYPLMALYRDEPEMDLKWLKYLNLPNWAFKGVAFSEGGVYIVGYLEDPNNNTIITLVRSTDGTPISSSI